MELLAILMRWTHIATMAFIVGGAIYSRLVLFPVLEVMGENEKTRLADRVSSALRTWMFAAVALLVISGTFNLLRKTNLPSGYHMVFGIKMLLALHVIGVALMLGKAGVSPAKRARWTSGIAISGLVILALSAYLRSLQQ